MHAQIRKEEEALRLVRERGVLRPRDLAEAGLDPSHLQRLYEQGLLLRPGRGVYVHPDAPLDEFEDLARVAIRAPRGVICLLSALAFHGIGTRVPHHVWLALPPHTHPPRAVGVPLRSVQMTDTQSGVERHRIGGIEVPIFSPARTVADCFKFRNRIGLEAALEALKDGWRRGSFTLDEVGRYAAICRVERVMQPYLETLSI